jgi:undecaprenyl-diphosphatase
METFLQSIILGLLEGATEFIPVSSTGHLLLAGHFLGFNSPHHTFEVLIQLGAILAVLSVYSRKLWEVFSQVHINHKARHFVIAVTLAFFPAAFFGVVLHPFIKKILFETPQLICFMLILGGIALIIVDRMKTPVRYVEAESFSWKMAFIIGLCQCLAMIPGVSRSGSTVIAGLLLGANKRAAAEFSFFLALPTMLGAFAYDFYKSYHELSLGDVQSIGIGFICAFFAGLIVVKKLLGYVSRHGYSLFGWWRILVGTVGLIFLTKGF